MTNNTQSTPDNQDTILTQLVGELVKEKRNKRRWSTFFKILFFAWLFISFVTLKSAHWLNHSTSEQAHTALIDIRGKIMENEVANADAIIDSLGEAFGNPRAKAIILRINSPGGTPVTADRIFHEIKRLKSQNSDKKIYAVCTDACASAAYYIASAADEIYANPSSLIGSIAVLYDGFGFVGTLEKLGVERRVFASGDQKSFLDPFTPMQPEQVDILKRMLSELHVQFVNDVKAGRGDRLQDNPDLFTGLYWTGVHAKKLGLIDGFGDARFVARELVKETNIIEYVAQKNYFERIAKQFGLIGTSMLNAFKPLQFISYETSALH